MHCWSFFGDVNFMQSKAEIFWLWCWQLHNFMRVKDENVKCRCSNVIFERKNCLNKNVQYWCKHLLTCLCSQLNPPYHLHHTYIAHPPFITVNGSRVNLWQHWWSSWSAISLEKFDFFISCISVTIGKKSKIRKSVNVQVCLPFSWGTLSRR